MNTLKKMLATPKNTKRPSKAAHVACLRPLSALIFTMFGSSLWGPAAWAEEAQTDTRLKIDSGRMGIQADIPKDEATYLSADRMHSNQAEEVYLDGQVEVRRNGLKVQADHLMYSPLTDKATANGNVQIEQKGMVLKAPEGEVKIGTTESLLIKPTYELTRTKGKGRADKLIFDGISTLTLENPNYTVCPVPTAADADKADWYIAARNLELDQTEEVGRAEGGKVVFKNVPILAAPSFSFPTSDRRKSGLLPPSIGTVSNSGLEVTTPYYWNIAPDKDMTLYPTLISGRGYQLGTQTRYLTPNNQGELKYDYLPNDTKTGTTRSALSFTHNYTDGPLYAGVNINKVSDDQYFVDFSRTQAVASQRILLREGFAAYREDNWTASVRTVSHQTLQLANDVITPPYDRLPEASLDLSPTRVGNMLFASASTMYTDFANPNSTPNRVEGARSVTRARMFLPINKAQFSLTPALSVQATSYNLQNQTTGLDNAPSSVIPTASLDGTVYFDRQTSFFGRAVNQTLEPRVFYLYTPYKDQSAQPLFDTSVTDQTISRIFSENRYAGYDRVGDANQVTYAITSRFSDATTSEELFSVTAGQRLNLTPQRIVLSGLETASTNDSDYFVNARGRLNKQLYLDATSQINSESGRNERSNFSVNYSPSQGKQLNFGYRYTRTQIDQFDISGQWPISQRWSGVGRFNYSMLDKRMIDGVAGLEYSEGCWAIRMVAQRFATAPQLETTSFFLQLELSGLGRIGSNPLDLLSRKVPGYTPFSSSMSAQ